MGARLERSFELDPVLSRRSLPRTQNQYYEDYSCQDPRHNPNPRDVVHRVSSIQSFRSPTLVGKKYGSVHLMIIRRPLTLSET